MLAPMLPSFLLVVLLVELTPGPNMGWLALLSASEGRRAGFAATAGIGLGLAIVAAASALGLAQLAHESPLIFNLCWVGISALAGVGGMGLRAGGIALGHPQEWYGGKAFPARTSDQSAQSEGGFILHRGAAGPYCRKRVGCDANGAAVDRLCRGGDDHPYHHRHASRPRPWLAQHRSLCATGQTRFCCDAGRYRNMVFCGYIPLGARPFGVEEINHCRNQLICPPTSIRSCNMRMISTISPSIR